VGQRNKNFGVIPAKAGLSTAELVIHLDLVALVKATWIPACAGMTTCREVVAR
jgi:hypothetical protein